jgi:tetratricopeptide (TPR) repeat protein
MRRGCPQFFALLVFILESLTPPVLSAATTKGRHLALANNRPASSRPSVARKVPGVLTPDAIFKLLNASAIQYRWLTNVDLSQPLSLVPELRTERGLNPFYAARRNEEGSFDLVVVEPPPMVERLYSMAEPLFASEDYRSAISVFTYALQLEPYYFKTYTLLGDAAFELEDYASAEQYLTRAIALNPVDYQAYQFLTETYYQTGQLQKALQSATVAFMLNRHSPSVQGLVKKVLAMHGQTIREDRLTIPVQIEARDELTVDLMIGKDGGAEWLALLACMACWRYEDGCRSRVGSLRSGDPFEQQMYKECFVNGAIGIETMISMSKEVSPRARVFYDAIHDGYLAEMLVWEIYTARMPEIIFVMPDDVKARVVEYIMRYVYVDAATELNMR